MPHNKNKVNTPSNPPNPTKLAHSACEGRQEPARYIEPPHSPFAPGGLKGTVVCPSCHAIWKRKRWHLDEAAYQELSAHAAVYKHPCPACVKIENEAYDGHVVLKSPLIPKNEEAIMGLIKNTEADMRAHDNPLARIAKIQLTGDTIEILTISTFLAERIGKALKSAYDGELTLTHLQQEHFIRVSWYRE
jgi:NMD protein affecting ribosome stability and mRNA decay